MADREQRQKILLLILVAILAFFGLRQLGGVFGGGPAGFGGRGRVADFDRVLDTRVEDLDLERMVADSRTLEIGRDPWRYGVAPRPPRPEPPPPAALRNPEPEVVREPPKPVPTEPRKPKPPPVDLEFIGSFGPEGRRIAVFEGEKDQVINALVGDVVNGKFRVVAIGLESVDLGFEGFPDEPPERLGIKGR